MPLAVEWVNRWTFSPSSPSSPSPSSPSSPSPHLSLFVYLRYRKCHGGGAWVLRCDAILLFTHAPCGSVGLQMDIFFFFFFFFFSPSPSSPSPHIQLFVSVRYRKHHGWAWVLGCVCHLIFLPNFTLGTP